jgi:hypothetical protein
MNHGIRRIIGVGSISPRTTATTSAPCTAGRIVTLGTFGVSFRSLVAVRVVTRFGRIGFSVLTDPRLTAAAATPAPTLLLRSVIVIFGIGIGIGDVLNGVVLDSLVRSFVFLGNLLPELG